MLVAALALLAAPFALAGERIEVALPDGKLKASLEIADFHPSKDKTDSERILLAGVLSDSGVLSLLCERNFPFVSGAQIAQRYAKMPRYATFDVDGVACCSWTESVGTLSMTVYHAWPTTPDYLFDIHASRTPQSKNDSKALSRSDFEALVRTFRCEGRVDAATLELPVAVYAFRDEAAAHASEQVAWVEAQTKARPDEWPVHYYLGALGYEAEDVARQVAGHERASQLLAAKAERDAKETLALARSYDALSQGYSVTKRYRDAVAPLKHLIALVPAGAGKPLAAYRTSALYHLAGCQAKNGDADEALKNLRAAIAELPALKDAAKKDELFDSLRKKPDFKKLVGD